MENVSKVQQLNNLVVQRVPASLSSLLAGLGLVIALGGLAALNPSLALTSSIIVLLIALTRQRPVLIVYALMLVLPLTGGLARGAVVPFLRISQALVVFGFILFMLASPSNQGKSRLTAIDLAFALYLLAGAVFPMLALYYHGDHINLFEPDPTFGVTPIQELLGPVQYYLLYRIVVAIISSERQIIVVLKLIFVASISVSVIGILQKLGVGPIKTFLETYYPIPAGGYDISDLSQRISSTLQHYSGLAAYLSFIIILALACYTAREHLKISRLLLVTTVLLDSVTLILTGTLAAWIALPISVLFAFLLMRRLPKLTIFALVGVVLAMIIFQPFFSNRLDSQIGPGAAQGLLPQSFALRIRIWEEVTLPAISQNLLFGAGPVPLQSVSGAYDVSLSNDDSQYIHLLLDGGLLYLLSYLLLMGVAVGACWRHIKSKSKDASRIVAIALLAILVALNIMNVSGIYFTYVGGTQTLWTLLAIVVASGQFKTPGPSGPAELRDNLRTIESKPRR